MIGIIDYGSGNTFSVYNSLQYLGYNVNIITQPEDLKNMERIILPGVGAYGDCMDFLIKKGFKSALDDEVLKKGKPFLGICLGMQVLSTKGHEKGIHDGLNWIPGEVKLFELADKNLKIPHVGWNDIVVKMENPIINSQAKDSAYYFVHSYHFVPESDSNIAAVCDYGREFVCAIMKDNIIGTQFHPEKSQKNGLAILENFADWRI